MRTLRLVVEYDGTDFAGWQRQKGHRTVQGCLEEALGKMVGPGVKISGASRTDAGVHADGQLATAVVDSRIPLFGFLRGLNSYLPADIAVVDIDDAPEGFDARRSARGKVYRYEIWNHLTRSPRRRRTTWSYRAPLDVNAMREAAALFLGRHDFRAFRAADCERTNTVRALHRFDVLRSGALITCEVEGTAFLKNMVRILVGTLVSAGREELSLDDIRNLLTDGNRKQAGVTAPAHGLTLVRVMY